ncbi:MAG: hypothetical protein ACD_63C00112G0004 [uncultured bacterium]|nr:MAG: hypothetical protein ACD_63C00112G0004 [uncultured bacterium]
MEKTEKRTMIYALVMSIIIFGIAIGAIYGGTFIATRLGGSKKTTEPAKTTTENTSKAIDETAEKKYSKITEITGKTTMLYFPIVIDDKNTDTFIKLKNNEKAENDDLTLTLVNRAGETHTYDPVKVPMDGEYKFQLSKLANKPANMDPGIAILSSERTIAAVAQLVNAEGVVTDPFPPFIKEQKDFELSFTKDKNGHVQQNTLVITNFDEKIIEVNSMLSGEDGASKILESIEIRPLETKLVMLENDANFDRYTKLIVSSTRESLMGAIFTLDRSIGLWGNIKTQ